MNSDMTANERRTYYTNKTLYRERDSIMMNPRASDEDIERMNELNRQIYLNSIEDPHADYDDEPIRKGDVAFDEEAKAWAKLTMGEK